MSHETTKKVMQDTLDVYIKQSTLGELDFDHPADKLLAIIEGALKVQEYILSIPADLRSKIKARSGALPFKQNRGRAGMEPFTVLKAIKPLKAKKESTQINNNYEEPPEKLNLEQRAMLLLQRTVEGMLASDVAKALGIGAGHASTLLYTLRKKDQIRTTEIPKIERQANGPKLRYFVKEVKSA